MAPRLTSRWICHWWSSDIFWQLLRFDPGLWNRAFEDEGSLRGRPLVERSGPILWAFITLIFSPASVRNHLGSAQLKKEKALGPSIISGKLMIRILSRLLRSSWIAKVSSNDLHLCWKASSTFSIQVASKRKFFVAHFSFFYSFGVIRNLRLYFSQASFKLKKLNFNKLALVLQSRMNHAD